jgi:two-component sensor histidine kinase
MREFFGKLLLEPASTGSSECRYRCRDGSYKWIEFTASNLLHDPAINGVLLNYRDVSERKRTDHQLRKNLEEKEVLLREVHHRVKNNLNVISSLLSLQSSFIKTPEQAIEAFRISKDRIMAMSIVHEELYQSSDYSRIDMASFLEKLTRQLLPTEAAKDGIRLEARAEGVALSVNASIPCGLILTELITNALRHAFPKGGPGEIRVALAKADDDWFELWVSDNGIGLDDDHEELESSALGLTLVRLLVEQLEGTMTVGSEKGTDIRIRFPERTREHP